MAADGGDCMTLARGNQVIAYHLADLADRVWQIQPFTPVGANQHIKLIESIIKAEMS